MKITKILAFAAIAIFITAAPLFAQEEGFGEAHVYKYPEIKPEYSAWVGYWFAHSEDSNRAGEYLFLEDSPSGGLKVIAFPFPHRVHIEADVLNEKDYFSDMRYAYKDLVLVRSVNRGVFHNLDNVKLVSGGNPITNCLTPGTQSIGLPNCEAKEYGYLTSLGNFTVRLKAPNFPAHAFVNLWYVDKYGNRQQRFLGGRGRFSGGGPVLRATENKDVDWSTTDLTVGVNSHLGPVEAEYSHSEKEFMDKGHIHSYPFVLGGLLPHNVTPNISGKVDTIKVHTSYTGQIVASATFSVSEDKNKTGSSENDSYLAAGEVVWTPASRFSAALRYRHEQRNPDNPDSLPAGYLGFPSFGAVANIRDSITSEVDTLSLIARYRPTGKMTVGLDASYKFTNRENTPSWNIKKSTGETTLGGSVDYRAFKGLKFKARYKYKTFDDPAYNIQPDDSHSGDISATWTPLSKLTVFASYAMSRERRDHIHITVNAPPADVGAEHREAARDTVTASATYLVRDNLSLTASAGHWRNKIVQDIGYADAVGAALPADRDVEYTEKTSNYTVSADYSPLEKLFLKAGVSYTRAKSDFDPHRPEAVLRSIDSFSRLKIRETAYEFESRYEVLKDTDLGLRVEYMQFDDLLDTPSNPEQRDGTAQIYLVTLSKRW